MSFLLLGGLNRADRCSGGRFWLQNHCPLMSVLLKRRFTQGICCRPTGCGDDCRPEFSRLDTAGISRAAIESLAENTSDGVTAPLFWGVLFGLPGVVVYKAINTADSMIG